MTKQRKLITQIVGKKGAHLTAEEIHKMAKEKMPSIAIGTVYRNLGIMLREGEVRKILVPGEPDRYEAATTQSHIHLICEGCGEIRDVFLPEIVEFLDKKIDVDILGYDIGLKFRCKNCAKK